MDRDTTRAWHEYRDRLLVGLKWGMLVYILGYIGFAIWGILT
jgi:hypothetical protein